MSRTPLDIAIAAAMEDPSRRMAFYGLFLEAELYFPIVDTAPGVGKIAAPEEGGTMAPLLLEVEGAPVLPVFDTRERLAEWASGTEMQFGGMPGYAIAEMAATQDPVVQIAFNVGLESFHHMMADEVSWLHDAWQSVCEPIDLPSGAEIRMAVPAEEYPELKAALRERMAAMPLVERAYVVLIEGLTAEVPYDVCVVLDVADPDAGSRIAEALVSVAAAHEPDGETVVISGDQPQILEFARTETQPFYERIAA
ncbi:MAG: enhanced serine sensitivity protein SseB C-terminal domain-containing protein [Rhodospirillaceae bacterium]